MKHMVTRLVLLFALTLFGAGITWAGNGAADGSGPLHDIFSGTYFEYSGTVVGCVKYEGLILDAEEEDEDIIISGVGPQFYWESLGVEHPRKGDYISVTGYTVTFELDEDEFEVVNIAMTITIDGVTVELRDANTGEPLWLPEK